MPKNSLTRKPRLFGSILAAACLVLAGEVLAPIASIGYTQYFWWIILLIAFFIPYNLISAELSTQYPSESGIYTWVKQAFGPKWAGRAIWLYWLSFSIWMAALANLATTYLLQIFGITLAWPFTLAIQLGYIVIVSLISLTHMSQGACFAGFNSIIKVLFMLGLGILGIYIFITHGTANEIASWTELFPLVGANGQLSFAGLGLVAVIIFSLLGFEVMPVVNERANSHKAVLRSILTGSIIITAIYLLTSFAISVAIPFSQISLSTGVLDSYQALLSFFNLSAAASKVILSVIAGMFIYSLIANAASWSFGVNSAVAHAAKDGVLPKSWAKQSKSGTPYVIMIWACVLAAAITCTTIGFWPLLVLSITALMLAYLPVFFAYIKLHKFGPATKKGYWTKGGRVRVFLRGLAPALLVVVSLFFVLVPEFSLTIFTEIWPVFVGISLAIIIGEIIVFRAERKASRRSSRAVKTKSARATKRAH